MSWRLLRCWSYAANAEGVFSGGHRRPGAINGADPAQVLALTLSACRNSERTRAFTTDVFQAQRLRTIWEAFMAKKRRGRPPGSKNKATPAKLSSAVSKMDIGQLRDLVSDLQDTLTAKVNQQRAYLESQLAGLQVYASNKAGAAVRTVMRLPPNERRRAPARPKYRSRKHKRFTWSGRGLMPRWMVEEMKGTKLTKDDFLIK
jgi:DNA-binding protein H-NS